MMLKVLIALSMSSCVHCMQNDDAIRFMYGGDSAPTQCNSDNEAILFIYGGSKAHQFKVTHAESQSQSHDEIISYLYAGNEAVDDVVEVSTFLYGGDHSDLSNTVSIEPSGEDDVALFLFGSSKSVTVTSTTSTAVVMDDVALLDRSSCLHKLTEWSPTSTFAQGKWMLQQKIDTADNELALFMLSGSANDNVAAQVNEMSEILFGGDHIPAAPTSMQLMHDVDIVDAHHSNDIADREFDLVDLVDMAEAADSELAAYVLGGEKTSAVDTSDDDLTQFLFGSTGNVQIEKTVQDLVEEHSSVRIADMVSLLDHADNADTLYLLGGSAADFNAPITASYAEDVVALVDRVGAEATEIALFQLGSSSETVELGSGPGTMEEDGTTMSYLYDGHGVGTTTAVVLDLYGGLPGTAVDEDTEAAKYLYGISPQEPDIAATKQPSFGYITSEDELIHYALGGDREEWCADEEAILFVLGETQTPTGIEAPAAVPTATDSLGSVEQWAEALPPAPYAVDMNEDCSDHECISRALQQMQAELGLSDEDLEDGMIWGEDMVEFCEWQNSAHVTHDDEKEEEENCDDSLIPSNCPTARRPMPALPSSYSMHRPPSLATCKQVLKPAAQMLKSN